MLRKRGGPNLIMLEELERPAECNRHRPGEREEVEAAPALEVGHTEYAIEQRNVCEQPISLSTPVESNNGVKTRLTSPRIAMGNAFNAPTTTPPSSSLLPSAGRQRLSDQV